MAENQVSSGIGCGSIMFLGSLTMVILKLAGVINWAWWIVLLPVLLMAGSLLLGGALLFVGFWLSERKSNRC